MAGVKGFLRRHQAPMQYTTQLYKGKPTEATTSNTSLPVDRVIRRPPTQSNGKTAFIKIKKRHTLDVISLSNKLNEEDLEVKYNSIESYANTNVDSLARSVSQDGQKEIIPKDGLN
ncbi:hypothetical protein BDC45DRAFT_605691 [Circinella umbellata]|nr:hypothetical protein BDC45DRAFT_605691 [Circinella umbellata]